MSFAALHTVEQQLVMQFCDRSAFLPLARCSRSILAAASSEFACRFLPPVPVRLQGDVVAVLSRSPLRFGIALWIGQAKSSIHSSYEDAHYDPLLTLWMLVLEACWSVPRLRALGFFTDAVPHDIDWMLLLSQPNLSRLNAVALSGRQLNRGGMQAIVALLPQLHSLRVLDAPMDDAGCSLLCKIPALTELDTPAQLSQRRNLSMLTLISQCASLRKLVLRDWQAVAVLELLTTRTFRAQIEELTLWRFSVHGTLLSSAWANIFTGLNHLRRLTLHCYNDVSALLRAAVTRCPTLETVIIRADLITGWRAYWTHDSKSKDHAAYHDPIPPPSTLRAIMQSRAEMHAANPAAISPLLIQLCVPYANDEPSMIHPSHQTNPPLTMTDWNDRVRRPFSALRSNSPAAVRFQLIEDCCNWDD